MDIKRLTRIAIAAVLIAVCSWITVPSVVPFTMQTFAVFCAVLILGGKDGTIAIGIYMLLGIVGLPVFSGFRGGIGHLLGPTGGYIVGFIFTGLTYLAFEPLMEKRKFVKYAVLALGLILCYAVGTLWFGVVMSRKGTNYGLWKILTLCVIPYIIPDLVKMVLAIVISGRVKKLIQRL